jgi:putative transposase
MAIAEVCREHNFSQVTFHRWKRQFGQMEVKEARRLKELERENSELKKMLADSLLKNRVLGAVCEKHCKPMASTAERAVLCNHDARSPCLRDESPEVATKLAASA